MRQITEQLKLALTGGWFQGDFGFKKKYQKKDYGKRPYQYDWVELLFCKLSIKLDAYRTAWVAAANEIWKSAETILQEIRAIPARRRSKKDKFFLIQIHVRRAIARKKKDQYEYRAKKWAWIFN